MRSGPGLQLKKREHKKGFGGIIAGISGISLRVGGINREFSGINSNVGGIPDQLGGIHARSSEMNSIQFGCFSSFPNLGLSIFI
jgi:hypothetical protein